MSKIGKSYTCSPDKLAYMFGHSVYTKCEKGWVFAKTKLQSIVITALH